MLEYGKNEHRVIGMVDMENSGADGTCDILFTVVWPRYPIG